MTDQQQFCEHCGHPLAVDAKFCETCGRAVTSSPTQILGEPGATSPLPPISPTVNPAPRHLGWRYWLMGALGCLALAGLLGGYYWGASQRSPQPPPKGSGAVVPRANSSVPHPPAPTPSPVRPPDTAQSSAGQSSPPPPPDLSAPGETSREAGGDKVITDIQAWNHPVKNVLLKNNVVIYKVKLINNATYPIFYVRFPYDPWFAHNNTFFKPLYYETLKANGFWDYTFVDESFECHIHIKWDKKSKTVTENITP